MKKYAVEHFESEAFLTYGKPYAATAEEVLEAANSREWGDWEIFASFEEAEREAEKFTVDAFWTKGAGNIIILEARVCQLLEIEIDEDGEIEDAKVLKTFVCGTK